MRTLLRRCYGQAIRWSISAYVRNLTSLFDVMGLSHDDIEVMILFGGL
jgi:hypothetical protein